LEFALAESDNKLNFHTSFYQVVGVLKYICERAKGGNNGETKTPPHVGHDGTSDADNDDNTDTRDIRFSSPKKTRSGRPFGPNSGGFAARKRAQRASKQQENLKPTAAGDADSDDDVFPAQHKVYKERQRQWMRKQRRGLAARRERIADANLAIVAQSVTEWMQVMDR
jgi:hypothetical protein